MWDLLANNEFAQGGLMLAALGVGLAYGRTAAQRAWGWTIRRLTWSVELDNHTALFDWLLRVLQEQATYRSRSWSIRLHGGEIVKAPAVGYSVLKLRGARMLMHRSRDGESFQLEAREKVRLSTMSWNREVMEQLLEDACRFGIDSDGRLHLYKVQCDRWEDMRDTPKRSLDSVVIGSEKSALLADVEKFLADEARYDELGIPYHRGYLLHGPPGNGKTSLVTALATHLGMSIGIVDLRTKYMDDTRLRQSIISLPKKSILLMEDVDCAMPDRGTSPPGGLTLSGLLNAIDGVATPRGQIIIMTTNHPEKLDPALLRPGRVDLQLEIRRPGAARRREMFLRYFPGNYRGVDAFVDATDGASMAEVQQQLQGGSEVTA